MDQDEAVTSPRRRLGNAGPWRSADFSAEPAQKEVPFKWVNDFPKDKYAGLRHGTFRSPSMNVDLGYCIYLPPGYDDPANQVRRYPVVYWLHGGRPGSEAKVISLTPFFDNAMKKGQVPPMIYVFPNGGIVSHYDYPKLKSLGETAFIKELIPHIEGTYRTIASRNGRAVEGFSQGGRGTARYMFKYPDMFCSAAPMGGGHQHEKRISENNGDEGMYQFEPGNNTYDLAKKYAAEAKLSVRILVVVGTKDMNYQANLDWMEHLRSLKIPFEKQIIEGVPHSTQMVYDKAGLEVMKFHADNFKKLEPKIGDAKKDKNGFVFHDVESELQGGPTEIQVLLPDRLEQGKRYPVLYVLPVEANRENRWGEGLLEVKKLDLHNKHSLIVVQPTFSHLPWYADHPSDPRIRQESYFVSVVVPFIERTYPAQVDAKGRLLLGFSKSGNGAFSLLLRHPTLFGRAVAWDSPLNMDKPSNYGMGPIYGTQENFEKYRIPDLLEKRAAELGKEKRLALIGISNFDKHHQAIHDLMDKLKISHEYRADKKPKHHWDAGWVNGAVEWLVSP